MPTLINQQTGLAEDLSQNDADNALNAGSHAIPLNDPSGNPVTAPIGQARGLLGQGYTQPNPQQLQSLLDYSKYSSPGQEAASVAEGAASNATFGLSTAAERGLGVDPKGILGRAQTNPGLEQLGQVGSFAVQSLMGVGEAKLVGQMGEMASKALVPAAETVFTKAGQTAVKQATEMALLQGGDEASKMFAGDPNQSAETAMTDIGLAALVGGSVGAVSRAALDPIWNATKGTQLSQLLQGVKDKIGGFESGTAATSALEETGVQVDPAIKATLSDSAESPLTRMGSELRESGTTAGNAFREAYDDTQKRMASTAVEGLGYDPDNIPSEMSEAEMGKDIQKSLVQELKTRIDPLSEQFEAIKDRYAGMPLDQGTKDSIAEDLGQLSLKEGYNLSEAHPAQGVINQVIKDLPNLNTLEDLRKYQSVARDNIFSQNLPNLNRQVSHILRDNENDAVEAALGQQEPQLLAQHQEARQSYSALRNLIDDVNSRLHVGKFYGPDSFVSALKEMAPEDVLRRLSGKGDANAIEMLQGEFPQTADAIAKSHLDRLVSKASDKALPGYAINTRTLFNELDKMSPEMRDWILPSQSQNSIRNVRTVLEAMPPKVNFSGTARVLDKFHSQALGGIGALISSLTGHGFGAGYVLGNIARLVGREAPDGGKLALLKFLGSDAPVDSMGFKSLYDTTNSFYKGLSATKKAVSNVFSNSGDVIPERLIPSDREKDIVKKSVKASQISPLTTGTNIANIGHYLPDHAVAFAAASARAMNYLNTIRPNVGSTSAPLDTPRQPSRIEQDTYDRAVELASQPLMILQHLKDGNISPRDVDLVKTVYPGLHSAMSSAIMSHIVDHVDSGEDTMPYKLKMGLSMLLGQPLESSLMPQNIALNQSIGGSEPPPSLQAPKSRSRGQKQALNKYASIAATPGQARELANAKESA